MRPVATAALLCAAALFASCAAPLKETRVLSQAPRFSLVIATRKTAFKERLIGELIERYRLDADIAVVRLSALARVKAEDYDVVLIIDSSLAWTLFSPALKAFLRKTEDKGKLILFMTAANTGWRYSYRGVDAITSASTEDRMDSALALLSERIDRIAEQAGCLRK